MSKGDEPQYPPGFTPDVSAENGIKEGNMEGKTQPKATVKDNNEGGSFANSGSNFVEHIKIGGSILEVMDELINAVWGNFSFDYASSASVGFSGGILCVWDPNLFVKDNVTASDSFLANGECVLMGDFNGVRTEQERYGLVFNLQEGLMTLFPSLSALCLDRHLSDHRPILLRELNVDYGPTPFWVFHSWFSKDGFDKLVEGHGGSKKLDQGGCNEETLIERNMLLKELHDLNNLTLLDMAQKAKVCWSIEGDENSKYFHGIINKKRSQLAIHGILEEGEWIIDPPKVKKEFLNHFTNRFLVPELPRFIHDIQFDNRLSSDQKDDLERNVTQYEIKRAVWECGTNKSPGPNGSTFEFIRRYWNIIDQDVMAAVNHFFNTSHFPRGCNSSFVALIPKTQDAKVVKDFRPISLIGCVYKIIAKILANRLSLIISDLISDVQSAFVSNRQILDGLFILNELLSLSHPVNGENTGCDDTIHRTRYKIIHFTIYNNET
ncbi:RNA-directed DNA polymerase, eukaryota [Tanacetum coccineum]